MTPKDMSKQAIDHLKKAGIKNVIVHQSLTTRIWLSDVLGEYAKQKDERTKELEAYVIDTDRILDSGIEIMPEFPHHERTKKLKSSI